MALEMTDKEIDNKHSRTRRNLITALILFTIFVGSTCYSVQSPIYPAEAEKKGLKPTQYGFVFGVFQLIIFLTSPLYGKHIKILGSSFLFKAGIFTTASCTILFGFLDRCPPGNTFLSLSVAVRVVAAFGESAVYTSSYVIAIRCQPTAVATALALVETAFGAGGILGPTFGGALYEIGGFDLPFFAAGSAMMFCCILSLMFIKEIGDVQSLGGPKVTEVFSIPAIYFFAYCVLLGSMTCGFVSAFLEPHLRTINVSPFETGLIFIAFGGTYAVAALVWGQVVERMSHYRSFALLGLVLYLVSFLLLGPVPFLHLEPNVTLTVISLVINGFGLASLLVCSALGTMDEIIKNGSPKNLETQGFVSGLYNALFAAGAFIGPTIGGPMFDTIGYGNATLVLWGMTWFAIVLLVISEVIQRYKEKEALESDGRTPLCKTVAKQYSSCGAPRLTWTHSYENGTDHIAK